MMTMSLSGFGGAGFGDTDPQCNTLASGDPANAGSYCVQPSGDLVMIGAGGVIPPDQFAWNGGGWVSNPSTNPLPGSGQSPSAAPQGTSWWSTALTALTQGVVAGAKGPTPPKMPTIVAQAPPWYTTPIGIGGIVLTLGLGYFLLKK